MQQDLSAALSQLRELQNNLSDLQKAHRDSQTQLEDRERANTLLRAGSGARCRGESSECCASPSVLTDLRCNRSTIGHTASTWNLCVKRALTHITPVGAFSLEVF